MTMKFKTIADEKRNDWFAKNFGIGSDGGVHTEMMFYDLLEETCPDYEGGYFEMVEFSNGAKALMLDSNKVVKVSVPTNYYDGEMSLRALSLAAWMVAVNKMCWNLYGLANNGEVSDEKRKVALKLSEKFSDMFYRIRNALAGDPEAGEIFAYAD